MNRKLKRGLVATAAVAALVGGGAAIAGATGGGDDRDANEVERPIQGADLDRASAVALKETGGGKVTGTEAGDEEGAYEVEVTRADGSQVDVHLDKSFDVIDSEADHEDAGGEGEDEGPVAVPASRRARRAISSLTWSRSESWSRSCSASARRWRRACRRPAGAR